VGSLGVRRDEFGRTLRRTGKPVVERGEAFPERRLGVVGRGDAVLALSCRHLQAVGDLRERHTYRWYVHR